MDQLLAQRKLDERIYEWTKEVALREVAEDFPIAQACQHNRRVKCFVAWMRDMESSKRLPTCLSLVKSAYHQRLANSEQKLSSDVWIWEERNSAIDKLHTRLTPTPDSDRSSPDFVPANPKNCRDLIIEKLDSTFGKPRRCQPQKIWYSKKFGDWESITHFEIRRLLGPTVDCYFFLRRADSHSEALKKFRLTADDMQTNLDPLKMLGIAWSQFPLIGKSHEQLCANSVRTVSELFLSSISRLVCNLGIND